MSGYTFILPDLSIYPDEVQKFLEKDLIEYSTLNSLEKANRLNWWTKTSPCTKLWPLFTIGDGNCLLHAASLAMWGFQDRKLTLRSALHAVLSSREFKDALYRRWRYQQTRINNQSSFELSEVQWAKEWEEIVSIASTEPKQSMDDNIAYQSLEEIHVLALTYVLRRPIIIIADTVLHNVNDEILAPIRFNGIYLPFEVQAHECHRAPLLLTYNAGHFCALVSMVSIND